MAPASIEVVEFLTPAEAAVVSDVGVRDVNRVFDEDILPKKFFSAGERRCLRIEACPLINFYFHTADAFTSEARSHLIDLVIEKGDIEDTFKYLVLVECKIPHHGRVKTESWNIEDKFLTVNFHRFFEETTKRYTALVEAKNMVVEDSDILGGTPVIRGTRVPVYEVAASIKKGISLERIKAAYPSIDERAIRLSEIFADATPLRGRPKVAITRPSSAVVKRVPRRAGR